MNTFAPISWVCKKQGAISHSSTEAEVIALEASVRMEGIPALQLWQRVLEVFDPMSGDQHASVTEQPNISTIHDLLSQVDYTPTTVPMSSGRAKLILFEDNEAVIKMTIKGRSPNMRHVARTHRVDLDWLFERIQNDPGVYGKYVGTKQQFVSK